MGNTSFDVSDNISDAYVNIFWHIAFRNYQVPEFIIFVRN